MKKIRLLVGNPVQINEYVSQLTFAQFSTHRVLRNGKSFDDWCINLIGGKSKFGLCNELSNVYHLFFVCQDTLPIKVLYPESILQSSSVLKMANLFVDVFNELDNDIVISTHSDHIINGILVYCKQLFEQTGESFAAKVSIYHLSKDKSDLITTHVPIVEGYWIKDAPSGFFDQMDIDREFLVGF